MDERKKEIRKILSGYYADDGKTITAAKDLIRVSIFGSVTTGAFPALLFGLKTGKKQIKSSSSAAEAKAECQSAFERLGRRTELQTAPDALCVLSFPLLHNPCIMTADFDGNRYLLTFYTARTLFSFVNVLRGFRKWKKNMPKDTFTQEKKITIEPQLVFPPEEKQ